MKKILSTALIAVVLSTMIVDTASAARATRPTQGKNVKRGKGRGRRGSAPARMIDDSKKVQIALDAAKKTDNPVVKQQAMRTANELAKDLLMNLEDRTWAGDVLGRYTEEQVAAAGKKYADLEVQKQALERDIASKQAEIDGMSARSMLFWTKAEGGKEEAHKIASEQLADMKATLKDVNKAMRNQAVIAGKEYCSAIRMTIGALTALGIAGGAYGIDKYGLVAEKGAGMAELNKQYKAARENLAMIPEETYGGYVKRGFGKVYTYGSEGLGSFTTWMNTQYDRLPDVPGLGAKARKERADAKAAIDAAANTQKNIITATEKLEKTTPDTPANDAAQQKLEDLQDKQADQIKTAEEKTDKAIETAAKEENKE